MPTPHAVILAAGASRRMGHPKGLLEVSGEPLILHHLRALQEVGLTTTVVLGGHAQRYRAILPHTVRTVWNPRWAHTHPADSLRLALLSLPPQPVWVCPVDVPPLDPETLRRLLEVAPPAVPQTPHGQDGHPVALDEGIVRAVRLAAPEGGLRTLLREARRVPLCSAWCAEDFDTPQAYDHFMKRWEAGSG